jgi:predicted nucleic acid-binding protein
MDRLFLDANVLFSAAYRPNAGLLRLWKFKNVVLCSSRYALEEARINLADEEQQARLIALSKLTHLFEAGSALLPRGISLPEKDTPILLAAIAADASHLLTGDVRHFGRYFGKKIEGIAIVLPGDYLRLRAREV